MSDEVDSSEEKAALVLQAKIDLQRLETSKNNVPFIEGECEVCGEDSPRLVYCNHPKDGPVWGCSRCRDKYKLTLRK